MRSTVFEMTFPCGVLYTTVTFFMTSVVLFNELLLYNLSPETSLFAVGLPVIAFST